MKKTIPIILVMILIVSTLATAIILPKFKYSANVKPHVRFNTLRNGCYYYYGYGSCLVENQPCQGVSIGMNKMIDLGDACGRNEAPILEGARNLTVTEGEIVKLTTECIDEDPVQMRISGWMTDKEKTTTYNDAGTYKVTVSCVDSFDEITSDEITITVKNRNRAPFFKIINHVLNP